MDTDTCLQDAASLLPPSVAVGGSRLNFPLRAPRVPRASPRGSTGGAAQALSAPAPVAALAMQTAGPG
eukprot:4392892-Alexandrium_andersonii.AAC.1